MNESAEVFGETTRIRLRQMHLDDLHDFQTYRDRDDVARFQSWVEWTRREAEAFIRNMQSTPMIKLGEWVQIGIALRATNQLIGDIGLWQHRHQPEVVQIGYTLDPQFQKRGLAREAVQLACERLLSQHAIKTILATVDTRKIPSMRLLQALDFQVVEKNQTTFKLEPCEEWTFALRAP